MTDPIVLDANTTVASPITENVGTTATATPPLAGGMEAPAPVVDPAPVIDPVAVAPTVADPAPAPQLTTPDWAQKRINELTAKRYEAERLAEAERDKRVAAERKNEELLTKITDPSKVVDPNKPQLTEAEIERRAIEKAQQMSYAAKFNEACDNIVSTGKKEFKDWDDAVKNLTMVGAVGPNVSTEFLETAIELKNPERVLHYLGTNLDEAERIIKSPPKKMAMELARIEATLNAPKPAPAPIPVSSAPAPVVPLASAASKPAATTLDDPNLTTEEFMRLRSQQAAERQGRYRRA